MYIITKKQIIEALEQEPVESFAPGAWITGDRRRLKASLKASSPACHVCAVGSIIRRAMLDKNESALAVSPIANELVESNHGVTAEYAIEGNLRDGHYFAAISCVFESKWRELVQQWSSQPGPAGETEAAYKHALNRQKRLVRDAVIEFVKTKLPDEIKIKDAILRFSADPEGKPTKISRRLKHIKG